MSKQSQGTLIQLQQAAISFRAGVFALFAAVNLNHASYIGAKTYICCLSIQTLQWLQFSLASAELFPWTNTYISWLRNIIKISRFDLFITDDHTSVAPMSIFICLLVTTLCIVAAAVLLGVQLLNIAAPNSSTHGQHTLGATSAFVDDTSSVSHQPRHVGDEGGIRSMANRSVPLRLFTTALSWSSTVLFLPISALLIGTIRCPAGQTSCFEGSHLASLVMAMITLALWLPLCFLYVAFKFPRSIRIASAAKVDTISMNSLQSGYSHGASNQEKGASADSNDRSHNRVALLSLTSALALNAAYELAGGHSMLTQWGLALGFLTLSTAVLIAQTWYLALRNRFAQAISIGCFTVLVWSGVCLIITLLYNDTDQVVGSVLLLLGTPLLIALSQFVLSRRREFLLHQPLTAIQDPLLMELKLRLVQDSEHDAECELSAEKIVTHLSFDTEKKGCISTTSASGGSHNEFVKLMEDAIHLCETTSTPPLFNLQLARMCSTATGGRQRVALLLQLSANREPALDVQFGLYCLQECLDESLSDDMKELSVQRYMSFRTLSASATEQVIVAARCQKAFFNELATPEPNMEKLIKEGLVREVLNHQRCRLSMEPQVLICFLSWN